MKARCWVAALIVVAACGDDAASEPSASTVLATRATTTTSATPTATAPASTASATTPTTAEATSSTTTSATAATSSIAPTAQGADATQTAPGSYQSVITHAIVDNPAFDAIEEDLTDRVTASGLGGMSLLVVQHGELIEQEAWLGYDLDTVVRIASASKWLTGVTLMTLVDDGALALDTPIVDYLPDWTFGNTTDEVTVRQLLSFTSGLPAENGLPCFYDTTVALSDCARQFAAADVVHAPGGEFHYGGQHMLVAAALAERVTGTAFADLFVERVAEPLGLSTTRFAQIVDGEADPTHVSGVTHPNPAASAVSSLGDYGRFLEMLSHDGVAPDGSRIVSSAAIDEMGANQTAGASQMPILLEYGLGHWREFARAGAFVHTSPGKFGFRPWIDRANDLFAVYLVFDDRGTVARTGGPWLYEMVAAAVGGPL